MLSGHIWYVTQVLVCMCVHILKESMGYAIEYRLYEIQYSEEKNTTPHETIWTYLLGGLSKGLLGSEWTKSRGNSL